MAKFINQKCVHCLSFCEILTEDHVFPESWYPINTPADIEKWTVPACEECNKALGKMEDDLRLRLGMCIEESDEHATGIQEKVMRMIDPHVAKDSEGYNRKTRALLKVIKEMSPCDGTSEYLLKHANHWHGADRGKMIRIPSAELDPFIKKMTRGLEFKLRGRLVEADRDIVSYKPRQNNPHDDVLFKKFEGRINSCLQTVSRGPGLIINYGVNPYNDGNVIYKIMIWGKYEFWAQIYPTSMIRKSEVCRLS